MPHLKPVTGLRLRRFDSDPLHARRGRALVQMINELLDGNLVAFEMSFDAAVGSIADPADDTQRLRLFGGPGAEEDALDLARYSDMAGNSRHHTVAMSGASSAFMPTTL